MDSQVLLLSITALVFILITWFTYRMYKQFQVSTYVWGVYTLCSVMSIVYYFQPMSVFYLYGNVTVLPTIYWLLCMFILMRPIYKFDKSRIVGINYDLAFLRKIAIFGLIISIYPLMEQILLIPKLWAAQGGDFSDAVSSLHDENSIDDIMSGLGRNLLRVNIALYDLSFILLIVFFMQPKRDRLAIFSLLVILLTRNATSLLTGHRSSLVEVFLKLALVTIIAIPLLSQANKKFLLKSLSIVVICFFSAFAVITVGRVITHGAKEEDFTLIYFLSRYMGESLIHFNEKLPLMHDVAGGRLCFTPIAEIIYNEDLTSKAFWDWLEQKQHVPQNIFYTVIGNFVQDFGFIATLIISIIVSSLMNGLIKVKNGIVSVSTLYIFVLYATILLNGITSWMYAGVHFKFLLFGIFVYFILKAKKI